MAYDYLGVITLESETIPKENILAINLDIPDYPYLEYYKNGEWVTIDNYSNPENMAKFEDLYTSLYEREWGIGSRLYTKIENGKENLYMTTDKYDDSIPVIKDVDNKFLVSQSPEIASKKEFEELYIKLMKVKSMNDIKEIDLGYDYYHYLVSTRNLIDNSSVIDLYSFSENTTDYSNILNLNQLLQKKDLNYKLEEYTIRLEIMYVKSGSKMSGTFVFDPFDIDTTGNLSFNNFQTKINDEVTVEIKNGSIRVFSDIPEISECIIYHCYLVYEKLL